MKSEAIKRLVKDLAILGCGIAFIIAMAGVGGGVQGIEIFMACICGGFPFGWRWLSKIFISLSFYMLIVKFFLSVTLGWIACPIVLTKDIIELIKAKKAEDAYIASTVMSQQYVPSQPAVTQGVQGTVQQPAAAATPAPQPQVYRCPTCGGAVMYGEANCRGCGTAFNWG